MRDSEALRKAVEEVQPLQVKLGLRLAQSKPLYEAFRALRDGPEWDGLSEARKRVVENELRDFVLGGVALEVISLLACTPMVLLDVPNSQGLEKLPHRVILNFLACCNAFHLFGQVLCIASMHTSLALGVP